MFLYTLLYGKLKLALPKLIHCTAWNLSAALHNCQLAEWFESAAQTYQLELTLNLLSINDVKLSIRNGETSPSYHPICGCDTSPKNKKLKHQNHAWTHIRSGGTHSEHTLINLHKEYDVIIWVMLSSTKEYIRKQSISVYNIHEKIMCIWLAETSASFM